MTAQPATNRDPSRPRATRPGARWSAADEARLLAELLAGATPTELAAALGRSSSRINAHLTRRGWPTPHDLVSRPGLAAQLHIEVVREGPPAPVVPAHRRRPLPAPQLDAPPSRPLTEADLADLYALPPPARKRQWARLVGFPVHDHAPVPAAITEAYARLAPPALQRHADPQTERHAARRWAHQTGRPVGTRGRMPRDLLPAFRAAGSPGLAEAVAVASQAHVRAPGTGGPVVTDPAGLRHRIVRITGPGRAITACGRRVDAGWCPKPELEWAKAGALRCTECRDEATSVAEQR